MDLLFVKSEINYWFPEEKDWTERYLTQRLTVRRTIDFYNTALDKLKDKSFSDKATLPLWEGLTSIRTEVHDPAGEAYRKALNIKDEEEFKRFIIIQLMA